MISIIIPAHNEEKVIAETLRALLNAEASEQLEIIVVCNGCTDRTADVVRSFEGRATCVETPLASKPNALNLGDSLAKGFPRIYQDADVVLSLDAVVGIARALRSGRYLAAAPEMQMDLRRSSWTVHAYYEVWRQLPYVREGMIGTGVYALSEEGRMRFERFPQIIADDGYIRALFSRSERTSLETLHSRVRAPANLAGLLKIKTRSRLGRYQLAREFGWLLRNEQKHYARALLSTLLNPALWWALPIYMYVNFATRIRARQRLRSHDFSSWERDDSSRQ